MSDCCIPNKDRIVYVYTIIRSGADADRGSFPMPYPECSFFSYELACEELNRLVTEEKKTLSPRLDKVEEGEDFWEAFEDGYAAAYYIRLKIVTSKIADAFYLQRGIEHGRNEDDPED